ncbi:Maf family protein [Candidatus Venteria ishoeyi]|uniref:7-methyl-GTP pyrophosphatase n=1 Tax=Candidatus Venteria ishoeyi TaxID=1899563 RepID=A0A1H6FDE4_9GAMM|nr:Maf family nucleotide pyrophosphatase [Candidatus Venteria ishoeyi]MDM8546262.1 Maf family nucleotide pyrophosphatase [Candidatus Venteria ishoeyi]SEH07421.1 Maf-like protein YceF [Candidatus Venteria ishoeyi]
MSLITEKNKPTLVLASTSPFRKTVLERLHLSFELFAPNIDESAKPGEKPEALVQRLAKEKAMKAKEHYDHALSIGSDQMAVVGDTILGKPGCHDRAVEQLRMASGRQVDFLTGLCLYNTATGESQTDIVVFSVHFRQLQDVQIERYLQKDKPYHCSGSFKSEGFGIALLDKMEGTDPTAVIGLPLIRLVRMLENAGLQVI